MDQRLSNKRKKRTCRRLNNVIIHLHVKARNYCMLILDHFLTLNFYSHELFISRRKKKKNTKFWPRNERRFFGWNINNIQLYTCSTHDIEIYKPYTGCRNKIDLVCARKQNFNSHKHVSNIKFLSKKFAPHYRVKKKLLCRI